MNKIITILFILNCQFSVAQNNDTLLKWANHFFHNNQFDSAQLYYQKLLLEHSEREAYFNYRLGESYFMLKNYKKAESKYLASLKSNERYHQFLSAKRQSCLALADMYIEMGLFDKALYYLFYAEENHPYRPICGAGEFDRRLLLAKKFSLCYEQLNKLDSAINYITPFMFADVETLHMDSVEYVMMCKDYFNLLKKVYQHEDLKSMLECSIASAYYKKESAKERGDKSTFGEMYYVDCYFMFAGAKVTLTSSGYEAKSWGGEPVVYFTKKYILDHVSTNPTYKLIME